MDVDGRDGSPGERSAPARLRRLLSPSILRYLIPASVLIILLAGGGFAAIEVDTVSSYWEGLWWTLSLVTTVGFVDGTPATVAGKVLSGALMLMGVVMLALITASLASLFVSEEHEPEEIRERGFEEEVLVVLRGLDDRLDQLERRLPD